MIATFFDSKGNSTTYDLGENMSLQDALNATRNNHFAPTLVVLSNLENSFKEGGETVILENTDIKAQLGKHTIEDILDKHKISLDKVYELVREGTDHEIEHTDNYRLAAAIATDHIYEHLDYYQRLKQVNLAYGGLLKHAMPKEDKNIKVEICVPTTDIASQEEVAERIKSVTSELNKMFGNTQSRTDEGMICVQAYATKQDWDKHKRTFAHQVSVWANDWQQESVAVEYNDTIYHIASHYQDEFVNFKELTIDDI